jgi:hypothetical protein
MVQCQRVGWGRGSGPFDTQDIGGARRWGLRGGQHPEHAEK